MAFGGGQQQIRASSGNTGITGIGAGPRPGANPSGRKVGGSGGFVGPGGSGGGGGGGGGAALSDLLKKLGSTPAGVQQEALKPYTSNTQVNPMLQEAYGAGKSAITNAQGAQNQMSEFADSLADKSNENLTNAMQRGRDATAIQLSDVREGAGARGGGGLSSLLQVRAAMAGNRQNQALNADLTEKALGVEQNAREGVIRGATGVTGATSAASQAAATAAEDQRVRDQNAGDLWKFTQTHELDKTKTDLDNRYRLAELAGKFMNSFSG